MKPLNVSQKMCLLGDGIKLPLHSARTKPCRELFTFFPYYIISFKQVSRRCIYFYTYALDVSVSTGWKGRLYLKLDANFD